MNTNASRKANGNGHSNGYAGSVIAGNGSVPAAHTNGKQVPKKRFWCKNLRCGSVLDDERSRRAVLMTPPGMEVPDRPLFCADCEEKARDQIVLEQDRRRVKAAPFGGLKPSLQPAA